MILVTKTGQDGLKARLEKTMMRKAFIYLIGMMIAFSWDAVNPTAALAQSQSEICRSLVTQLASLDLQPGAGGNPQKYRQYNNAIRKQQIQLNKAQRAVRRYRCVGILKNRNNRCRQITGTITQMQANLRQLEQVRAQFAPSGAQHSRKRSQLRQAMEYNGCYGGGQVVAVQPQRKSKRRTLLEQIFGVRTYDERGVRRGLYIDPDSKFQNHFGTFRTLCVRKVDGYYFPISFSTVPERFDQDEQTCLAMCPDHPMELFVHRMPQEDSEDMISYRSEIPYREQPFAFAYRQKHNPELQCRFSVASAFESSSFGYEEQRQREEEPPVGIPVFRKDPTQFPDDFDNMSSGFTLERVRAYVELKTKPVEVLADRDFDPERKIRIVGPAFFPVQ